MPEVNAGNAAIFVHQPHRGEYRHSYDLANHPQDVAGGARGHVGEPECDEAPTRPQQLVTLAPVVAAERVQYYIDALAISQSCDSRLDECIRSRGSLRASRTMQSQK